ncbi:MAG TPA: biosynthetic peptidoglycan transglycosylase [Flavobacterium sp.]|jgi:hypothetical protein
MRTRKQKVILAVKVIVVILILAITAFYIFRESLLKKAILKVETKIERDYDADFSIKEAKFDGLTGVQMKGILLIPHNADTLLNIESIKTTVSVWKLFVGSVQLGTLEVENGFIQLIKDERGRNFESFLHPKGEKTTEKNDNDDSNIAERAYNILTKALNLIPTDMRVENVSLRWNDMGKKFTMDLKQVRLENKQLEGAITVTTNTFKQNWRIAGYADPRNKKTDLKFFNSDGSAIRLPYVDERFNLHAAFDSVRLKVDDIDMDGDELQIEGFTSVANLLVNHPKIASQDVNVKKAEFEYRLKFGPHFMAIDSSSTALVNSIKFHPHVEYNVEKDTLYKLFVSIPKMKAQNFINSLPTGLFSNFEGMVAEGSFDYKLNFIYNKNRPNALVFNSKINKEKLRIVKYGAANLAKLNGSFTYRAIENGRPQRAILVSPENPNYTPLNQISPNLRNAVLTAEDPSYFRHRGFINDAFKQSIVQNIKTKKFSRGASTISMQLVKNVFLTREKTLSRKLEEILLVYLLENNRIASKERMLEVYFNVIEWGPNVYGVGEASMFYFSKYPSELTLNESLFMASIIPRPKAFMWQFDSSAQLKPFAVKRNNYMRNIMQRRGLVAAQDSISLNQNVTLYGRARSYVYKQQKDTIIAIDTLQLEKLQEFDEFDF